MTSGLAGLYAHGFLLPDFREQCPELYISKQNAILDSSDKYNYCIGKISVYAKATEIAEVITVHCILGYDPVEKLLCLFFGDKCKDHPQLAEIGSIIDSLTKK